MPSRPAWTLVVEDRFGTVTDEYVFDAGELVVGRSRQSDIVLPSENVSRSHARLFVEGMHLFIEDLGSSNGIWSGTRRIEGRLELADGDSVRVGDFQLRIRGARDRSTVPAAHFRLVGTSAGVLDQTFGIEDATTLVGRGRDCGVVLVEPSVSRVHARLRVRPDGAVLVEDVGSANGLFVNGTRVKVWQLADGDRVRFGHAEFRVEMPGAGDDETPVPSRPARRVPSARAVLPWVLAGVLLATAVAAVALWAGGDDEPRAAVATSVPDPGVPDVPADAPAPPDPGPAPIGTSATGTHEIERATALANAGRLEEAAGVVATVLAASPGHPAAVRLSDRIDAERRAARALADADRALEAGRTETAVQHLLTVPPDCARFVEGRVRLQALRPILAKRAAEACRGDRITSVPCIRSRSLLARLDAAVRP